MKTVFDINAVSNSDLYKEGRPIPYKVKTDLEEIEMQCELCLEL